MWAQAPGQAMPHAGGVQIAELFAQHAMEHLDSICKQAGASLTFSLIIHHTSESNQRREELALKAKRREN